MKRVVLYMPEEMYKALRAKLVLAGISVSAWFRQIVTSFLQDKPDDKLR